MRKAVNQGRKALRVSNRLDKYFNIGKATTSSKTIVNSNISNNNLSASNKDIVIHTNEITDLSSKEKEIKDKPFILEEDKNDRNIPTNDSERNNSECGNEVIQKDISGKIKLNILEEKKPLSELIKEIDDKLLDGILK
jgi:hypothetical protein